MIPLDYITEWRASVPWISSDQVEQDLIISRALVEIYKNRQLGEKLAFRGGTALHKLFLSKPYRYSEDLDFLQTNPEKIGETLDALREILDPWLGIPRREAKEGLVKLQYRFQSADGNPLRLKLEINFREHFAAKDIEPIPYSVESRWFSGSAHITGLSGPWLLGSKLRALYQRKKGRDLFDLVLALREGSVNPAQIVHYFLRHLEEERLSVSRAEFEENLCKKLDSPFFCSDLNPLLPPDYTFDIREGYEILLEKITPLLPGSSWKGLERE